MATTVASRKQKGRKLQQSIAQALIERLGIEKNNVRSTPMGVSGCDLMLSNEARNDFRFGVEAKCQESLSIWAALAQCENNATEEELLPLLVFKRNRSDTWACLKFKDLLDLLVELKELGGEKNDISTDMRSHKETI